MEAYKEIFKRAEKKFVIDAKQMEVVLSAFEDRLVPDSYGESIISNIYYDTPSYRLIRTSLQKPVYKEKLRLRAYGKVEVDTPSFVEIKKKYKGIVYKRRIALPYEQALEYLNGQQQLSNPGQISKEIDWFKSYYQGLKPSMFISYKRKAFYDKDNPDFRITFDTEICWRNYDLDLKKGVYGHYLTQEGQYVMEIKIKDAFPVELAEILSEAGIFHTSYSKYGNAFLQMERENAQCGENVRIIQGGKFCA